MPAAAGVPTHAPATHRSSIEQRLPSSQPVPSGFSVDTHAAEVPAQTPAFTHAVAAPPHATVEGAKASVGHAADAPEHCSSTSQAETAGRQLVAAATSVSAGHAGETPSQASATSHAPPEARHTVEAAATASSGQAVLTPSQTSATSHTSAAARHGVAFVTGAQTPSVPPVIAATHAWQSAAPSPHAVSQQTPSVQEPDTHSDPSTHDVPFDEHVPVGVLQVHAKEPGRLVQV